MKTVGIGIGAGQASGTVRIQFPDLSGSVLIIEDENVDPLVELLRRVEDIQGTPLRVAALYVDPSRGMGNLVDVMGRIQTDDVRLVLSDHNLKLSGPNGQPITGALFLHHLADAFHRQPLSEATFLAAYTGFATDLEERYGDWVQGIPIIEKGGMQDVMTYCAATLAAVNELRRRAAMQAMQRSQTLPVIPEEGRAATPALFNLTLAGLVEEIAGDIRGNAGVKTGSGIEPIGTRIGTSYEGEVVIDGEYLTGAKKGTKEEDGSLARVLGLLVSYCEHATRVRPTYLLDARSAERQNEFDFPQTTSLPPVTAASMLKVTLRVDQQVEGMREYVSSVVIPAAQRAFASTRAYGDNAQRGSYVLQLLIPGALAR